MTYQSLPGLMLRTPFFSFARYDLARLPETLGLATFRNAVLLASPVLYQRLEKKNFAWERLNDAERHSLAKYYNRMCYRPTPFGHFAAFSLLEWGSDGPVLLAPGQAAILHLLPDNASQRVTLPDTPLIVNPLLYRLGRDWRYYRSEINEHGNYDFILTEMDAVKFTNELLRGFRKGRLDRPAVLEQITGRSGCSAAEAADYLGYLLSEQVLLSPAQGSPVKCEQPQSLTTGLVPGGVNGYAALERPVLDGGPGTEDREELSGALRVILQLSPPMENTRLRRFIQDFSARFELERVPLLTALDPDAGIAYGAGPAGAAEKQPDWTALHRLIFERWRADPSKGPQQAVMLTAADLETLPPLTALDVNTCAVVYRKTTENLLIEYVSGPSATRLSGRFSAFSEPVHDLCRNFAQLEQNANPGVIFADIAQRSGGHVDNINRRRPIYDYELPLNVYSALPLDKQLLPSDLLLSVRNGELILESQRLGKRVIPRLSTAFNYELTGLPVFDLLGDLQYQHARSSFAFDPERLFPGLKQYPRLVYGRTVLCAAKWNFGRDELAGLFDERGEPPLARLRAFRLKYTLPAYVALGSTDQQLIFNLAEPADGYFFLTCLKKLKKVTLQEYLLPDSSVRSGHKPLAGQFVAFFGHDREIFPALNRRVPAELPVIRSFPPGSAWLYVKLYCTALTADRILAEVIRPVLRVRSGRIAGWFFVRYADPGQHLRIRIRFTGKDNGTVLAALQLRLQRSGLAGRLGNFSTDTYRRELERYGPDLITQVEKVFEAGSDLVVDRVSGAAGCTEFQLGLASARLMLGCILRPVTARRDFAGKMAAQLLNEFDGSGVTRRELDGKFRALRQAMAEPVEMNFAPLVSELHRLANMLANKSEQHQQALLADLVHMQLNRTFAGDQRRQELLVYHCLQKQIAGELARAGGLSSV